MPLRLGLDFDGVFMDCARLKDDVARDLYNMPYHLLNDGERQHVRDNAYHDPAMIDRMQPLDGAFERVAQLHTDGYDMRVITSRDGDMLDIAEDWYAQQRDIQPYDVPDLEFIGVGLHDSKSAACEQEGVDVFVDDDLYKLAPLQAVVPHRYHFQSGHDPDTNHDVAAPVQDWDELYHAITGL